MRTRRSLLNGHVLAVLENEWAQLIRNKVVIFTTLVPPMLLVMLAVVVLVLASVIEVDERELAGLARRGIPGLDGVRLSGTDTLRATLLNPFLVLFQVIPLIVPITIAAYTIVGEKQQRSLEPLLATPIRTWELLVAKALSAAIPGILSTWWGFAIFLFAGKLIASDSVYNNVLLSPTWVLSIVLIAPLLTLLAVGLGVVISSRVKEPSSAQQLGSLVILPVIGMLVAQVAGYVEVSASFIVGVAVGVALLDVALLFLSIKLFHREEILTNWTS
ncbi:MAG TPA: ABC transporter permease subunit [Chloroflexia bacterium]|nr:ABC transporter permease subunit [Chloroflexia bacterium]